MMSFAILSWALKTLSTSSVVGVSPQLRFVRGALEMRRDPDSSALLPHAAVEHMRDAKLLADPSDGVIHVFVLHDGMPADDHELLRRDALLSDQCPEVLDQLLRHAVRPVI